MMSLTEQDLVIGSLYKIQVREDYNNSVKYSYFYYNGIKESKYSIPFHEFIPKLKSHKKKVYTLRLFINDHQNDYEYDEEGNTTANYHFYTTCFIDNKGIINMPNIKDMDLYGYDTLHFNIYHL